MLGQAERTSKCLLMIIFVLNRKRGTGAGNLALPKEKKGRGAPTHRGIQIKDAAADSSGSSAALIVTVADC